MILRALLCAGWLVVPAISGCAEAPGVEPSGSGAAAGSGGSGSGGEALPGGGAGGSLPIGPPSVSRVGDTFEIPTIGAAAPKRFVDVAHDPTHDGYLVVHGNAAIGGAFVDADGAPRGQSFQIAQTTAWGQAPRARHGGAAGAFLVAWHDIRDGEVPRVRGRLVRWSGSDAAFLGDDFAISGDPSYQEMPPGIAFSETSQVFLVVWQRSDQSDVRGQRISTSGELVGDEIVLSSDPDWQSDASIAWHPERDEFCIAYSHAGAFASIVVKRVAASSGELVGQPVMLTRAGGTWLPQVVYLPSSGGYLIAWYQGTLEAVILGPDLAVERTQFPLFPGLGAYDGFAFSEVSPTTGTIAAVMHGHTDEAWAGAVGADGEQSEAIEATSSPGDDGNFNPRIAAHGSRKEWMVVDALGFASVVGQRLGP